MNDIKTIDELYEALCLNGVQTVADLEKEYARIAYALINNFGIQKGDKVYRFVEIEFYHTIADKSEGIEGVTYFRVADALRYFFHKSGMDITFLSSGERYGGILIRGIRCGEAFINGPQLVVDALFDQFAAQRLPSDNYPLIIPLENSAKVSPVPSWRYHITVSDKQYRYTLPISEWKDHKNYSAFPWDYKGYLRKK